MTESHCCVDEPIVGSPELDERIGVQMPLLTGNPTAEEIQERMAGLEDRLDAICRKISLGGYHQTDTKIHDLNRLGNDFAKLEYYLFLGDDSLAEFYPLLDLFTQRLQRTVAATRGEIAAGK